MTLSKVSKIKRIKRAKEVLKDLGLSDQINKRPNQLSGGQKQRVAIARALVNNPDIILADEPTGSLDSETSMQILSILRNIAKSGKTIIMVTHSELVASISNRVVTISDGEIVDIETRSDMEKLIEEDITFSKEKQNLNLFSAIKLALNNMKQKLTRNILVSLGASIGIMSVVVMLSLGEGVKTYFNDTINENTNPLIIEVNKQSEETQTFPPTGQDNIPFSDTEIEELSNLEGVNYLEAAYSKMASGSKINIDDKDYLMHYINTISDSLLEKDLVEGTFPKQNEVMIGYELSQTVNDENIVGKTIEVQIIDDGKLLKREYVVSGIYDNSFRINQVFFNYDDLESLYLDNNIEFKPTTIFIIMDNKDIVE